jgi:hypothetical protein
VPPCTNSIRVSSKNSAMPMPLEGRDRSIGWYRWCVPCSFSWRDAQA